jgi:tryptophan synthase alpha chain
VSDATTATGATRVEEAFATARRQGRAALVVYLTAGYPDVETSKACFEAAVDAGADVLEVGLPFSDPMMDGPGSWSWSAPWTSTSPCSP